MTDKAGRIVMFSPQQIQAELLETFGLWSDRADIVDRMTYMDDIRRGTRLDEAH